MDAKHLREQSDDLFKKRLSLILLWQEIAENFYPERADFTTRRSLGTDFAGNLSTSYPIMCRRDLGDQFGAMLRPTEKQWFHMKPIDTRIEDNDSQRWLEWAQTVQRRAMYDPGAMLTRATKEGDHDFAAFGQNVISIQLNRTADGLLYRCWHLRDVAWQENEDGKVASVFRKWKPKAQELQRLFPGKLDPKFDEIVRKRPFEEVDCLHMMVEADLYSDDAKGKPWWSIYYDCLHDKVIEAVAVWNKQYIIPRWQTVSGSQYAYSPATVAALPDARLIQAMTSTLLQAGEKIVNPPMVAQQSVVKSDVSIYPGGITWVDHDYDERLGDALRPLTTDHKGVPLSREMQQDTRAMIMQAFYLNKLSLPQRGPQMTAYEIGQRVQEYIRGAMPIFEPMEADYNGALCEETFDLMLRNGAFGSPDMMPRALAKADIQFRFESPLHDAIEQQKGQKFVEMRSYLAEAMALDQSVLALPDIKTALRDVLSGIGVPARWIRNEADVQAMEEQQQQLQETQQILQTMQQAADVAATSGVDQEAVV